MTHQTSTFTRRQTHTTSLLSSRLLQRKCACGQQIIAGGECKECQKKRSLLQRRSPNQSHPSEVPPIVHEVLRSPGQPLDSDTRTFMESRFGRDFSQVRLHTDAKSTESAQSVNALAYTVGQDVVFGMGRYAPKTEKGRQLLAHELTHVVQQRGQQVIPIPQFKTTDQDFSSPHTSHTSHPSYTSSSVANFKENGISVTRQCIRQANKAYEYEADRVADAVMYGQTVPTISSLSSPALGAYIQREYSACFETNVEEFRRSPMCTSPTRVVEPGQRVEEICGVFPGGSTDCEVNEETGEITGRVTIEVEETNPCVRPCVELHERVHERQLLPLCTALRNCYQAADAGQRPVTDCWQMGLASPQLECEAYQSSVICLEERLATAPECSHPADFDYAWDVLEGEKCYLDYYCGQAAMSSSAGRSGGPPSGSGSGTR